MIFKKSFCPVCNQEINHKVKISDGTVCQSCATLAVNTRSDTVTSLKNRYAENQKRLSIFSVTKALNDRFFDPVFIDENHRLFYIENLRIPVKIIYRFDEVVGYEMRSAKQTINVDSNGRKTAAVQNNAIPCLTMKINTSIGIKDVVTTKPPVGLNNFLDTCLINRNSSYSPDLSAADELMKFNQLLDAGAITQQEFEEQKRKLLNL